MKKENQMVYLSRGNILLLEAVLNYYHTLIAEIQYNKHDKNCPRIVACDAFKNWFTGFLNELIKLCILQTYR